ncbi:MAG: oligosaccharide flippase family protein [Flavobacteriales bacterium]
MERRLFSDLALSLFLNLLIKPLSILFIDAGVQKAVGNEAYGGYFVLFNITVILNIFLDLGINNYSVRYIAQKRSNLDAYVAQVFSLKLLLFLVYIVLVCSAGVLMRISPDAFKHLFILILIQFIIQFIAFNRALLNGQHRFREDAVISVTDRSILIFLVGALLFFSPENITIEAFIIAQLISYSAALFLSFFLLKQRIKLSHFQFKAGIPITILKDTLPFALLILLMLLYNRIDSVLLQQLKVDGSYQAGIYAQAFRLLDALYMVGMIFAGMLYPVFSRMLHEKNQGLIDLVQSTAKILIGGSFVIAFVMVLNAEFLLSLIYGESLNREAVFVFQCLMVSFACMSFNFLFGTLLTANGSLKTLIISSFFGVVITTTMNSIFIPIYGVKSCAVVSILTQALVSVLLYSSSVRTLKIGVLLSTKKHLWFTLSTLTLLFALLFQLKTSLFTFVIVFLVGLDFYLPFLFEEMTRNRGFLNHGISIKD